MVCNTLRRLLQRVAPEDIRHSAQTVFGIIILGVGPVLVGLYNEQILDQFKLDRVIDGMTRQVPNYRAIWWTQAAVAFVSMLFIALAFRPGVSVDKK